MVNFATSFNLGYTGQYRDANTGLQLHGARWYDADIGRWLSEDPGGFIDGPNLYAYARNSPVDRIDPSGYDSVSSSKGPASGWDAAYETMKSWTQNSPIGSAVSNTFSGLVNDFVGLFDVDIETARMLDNISFDPAVIQQRHGNLVNQVIGLQDHVNSSPRILNNREFTRGMDQRFHGGLDSLSFGELHDMRRSLQAMIDNPMDVNNMPDVVNRGLDPWQRAVVDFVEPRAGALLQTGGGAGLMTAGALMTLFPEPATTIAGPFTFIGGADMFTTGVAGLWDGTTYETVVDSKVSDVGQAAGLSQDTIGWLQFGTSLAQGAYGTIKSLPRLFAKNADDLIIDTTKRIDVTPDKKSMIDFNDGGTGSTKAYDTSFATTSAPDRTPALPQSAWVKNAAHQVEPGVKQATHYKFNLYTGRLEKSIVEYDDYGRQIKRIDYDNHGYGNPESPDYHSNPHFHFYEYGPEYGAKGKETRLNE